MKMFLAGSTGAVGTLFLPLAEAAGHVVVPHVRPQSAAKTLLSAHPCACVADLAHTHVIAAAMGGVETVVVLVGTTRARFSAGDSYASSDVGAVLDLVRAGAAAGVRRVVLLSSLGAGGPGAYLAAKAEAEQIVQQSGLAWVIARPGAFSQEAESPTGLHGRRQFSGAATAVFGTLESLGLRRFAHRYGPMPLSDLAAGLLRAAEGGHDGCILHGDKLRARAE